METLKYKPNAPVNNDRYKIESMALEINAINPSFKLVDVQAVNQNKTIFTIVNTPTRPQRTKTYYRKNQKLRLLNGKIYSIYDQNIIDNETKINSYTFKNQLDNTSDIVRKKDLASSSKYHLLKTCRIFVKPVHTTLNSQLLQMFTNHCTMRKVSNVEKDPVEEIEIVKQEVESLIDHDYFKFTIKNEEIAIKEEIVVKEENEL